MNSGKSYAQASLTTNNTEEILKIKIPFSQRKKH